MNIIAILVILIVGYLWVTRGFFSALIHLICTVIAGAIAFACWEPLALALIDAAPERGTGAFLSGVAWGVGLAAPFAIALTVLRLAVDAMIPMNVKLPTVADYIGGGVCGAVAGVITSGIVVLSVGFLRMDTEQFGYAAVTSESNGSVKRGDGLWVPVDSIVGKFYGTLSTTTLRTNNRLGEIYPDLAVVPASLRMTFGDGKGKNTIRPKDFKVGQRYTVGEGKNLPVDALLKDKWSLQAHRFADLDGNQIGPGSFLEGYVVTFMSGAKETDGKVVFGNGQIRLVVHNEQTDDFKTVFPLAIISQAEAGTNELVRFRFDAKNIFFGSVGAAAEATYAIEFAVPAGYKARWLFVKNVREDVSGKEALKIGDPGERDSIAATGGLMGGGAGVAGTITEGADTIRRSTTEDENSSGIRASNLVPTTLNKSRLRGLLTGEKNEIKEGEQTFTSAEWRDMPQERELRVQYFDVSSDVVMVQVDVSLASKASWLGQTVAAVEDLLPVALVDTLGTRYEPVGFIYENGTNNLVQVRYTPGQPLRALKEIPSLSRSRPNDKLTLLFRISLGRTIRGINIGDKTYRTWNPPLKLDQPQNVSR